jgi:hypothetical protein
MIMHGLANFKFSKSTLTRNTVIWGMRLIVSDGPAENSSTLKMEAAGHCKTSAVSDMPQNIVSKKAVDNIHSCKTSYLMS